MYDLVYGFSLWMLCIDIVLEFLRFILFNVVYVGGILIKSVSSLLEVRFVEFGNFF